ncbi:hypothetical protein ILUMI_00134 [Ignelater luminosus]|uniref:Uncharacterized protein n=1 Tax=Ignelater luminosus TaxID=2038154 RepID=A0A8K0DHV7_IGNLU|nr:hypothetical protein ILUMI_00134 [Ignelater luminosus]
MIRPGETIHIANNSTFIDESGNSETDTQINYMSRTDKQKMENENIHFSKQRQKKNYNFLHKECIEIYIKKKQEMIDEQTKTGRNYQEQRRIGGKTKTEENSVDRSYRSDDTEDAVTTDNPTTPFPTPPPTLVSPRSPLPHHRQASPFPLENTNTRRIHYATPQDRLREVVYSSNKKGLTNSTLGRSGRGRHGRTGGMTSSSSATSCNSCADGGRSNDVTYHGDPQQRLCLNNGVNEESPPEPAPPEVPPRGPSLHSATLRRRAEYSLPVGESSQNSQESQFLSQGDTTVFLHAHLLFDILCIIEEVPFVEDVIAET